MMRNVSSVALVNISVGIAGSGQSRPHPAPRRASSADPSVVAFVVLLDALSLLAR